MKRVGLIRRVLRCAKTIDNYSSLRQSLCALPSELFSFRNGINVDIQQRNTSVTDSILQQINDGSEYSIPTANQSTLYDVSLFSIRYSNRPLREIETIVQEMESITDIIKSTYNSAEMKIKMGEKLKELSRHQTKVMSTSPKIEATKKMKDGTTHTIVLDGGEYTNGRISNSAVLKSTKLSGSWTRHLSKFRGTIMLQHPMATTNPDHRCIAALALDGFGKTAQDSAYRSVILNQKTMFTVGDYLNSENTTLPTYLDSRTFIPKVFHNNRIYYGGSNTDRIEIITTNRYSKGVVLFNGRWYWNPDLHEATQLIENGHAKAEDFRFYYGSMVWNHELLKNVTNRNLFGCFTVDRDSLSLESSRLLHLLWNTPIEEDEYNDNCTWLSMLQNADESFQSWFQLYYTLQYSDYLQQMKQRHNSQIAESVQQYFESTQCQQ